VGVGDCQSGCPLIRETASFPVMNSFTGKAEKSLDEKDRVVLPKEMRLLMDSTDEGRIMLARGSEKCIALYTLDVWKEKEKRVNALDDTKRKHRKLKRLFFGDAKLEKIDSAGRIRLPRPLMEIAEIEPGQKVIINSAGTLIEIWNADSISGYMGDSDTEFEDLQEEIFSSPDSPASADDEDEV